MSRDSVHIAFTVAALNGLDVICADVQNIYLNAPTSEKNSTEAGLEFGSNAGQPALIVRALYGLKSSGARWRDHMAATLRAGGFHSCLVDPDVWMKTRVHPNGDKYWEYLICYVDEILVISHDPQLTMDMLSESYTLKAGSVKEPDQYLGDKIHKFQIKNYDDPTKICWGISSDLYIRRAVTEVECDLEQIDCCLPTRVTTPLSQGYQPELDVSAEIDAKRENYYQGLISILCWMCD